MTSLPLLLVALAHAPCAPTEPPVADDPQTAAAYLAAAEAEWAAGQARGAVLAYREALRHGATGPEAHAGWVRACARVREEEALQAASAHLDAGRPREALATLGAVPEDSPLAADAALLRSVAHLALGEDAAARAALAPATREEGAADTARLLEAVLALRGGRAREAQALLQQARSAADARVRGSAEGLLLLLRGQERLRLSATARAGWDSNLARVPDRSPERGADAAGALDATLAWTPGGTHGPLLGASALVSQQLSQDAFDALVAGAHAGWQLGWGEVLAGGTFSHLGGAPFLLTLRVDTAARLSLGELLLEGDYGVRRESFLRELDPALATLDAGFSSWRHLGGAGVAWWHAPFLLRAGWRGELSRADAEVYSFLEHGPQASVALLTGGGTAVGLELLAADRRFLAVDPQLGAARADLEVGAALTASLPLGAQWSWLLTLQATRVQSSLAAFTYGRVSGWAGLRYTLGVP